MEKDKTNKLSSKIIIMGIISMVLFLLMIFVIIYYISSPSGVNSYCPVGKCATSLETGKKRCPVDTNGQIKLESGEVCNSKYLCDNQSTPFTVQKNGGTIQYGQCEDLDICQCLTRATCPGWVVTSFSNESIIGSSYSQSQNLSVDQEVLDQARELKPGHSCALPITWISRIGCPIENSDTDSLLKERIENCLRLNTQCSEIPLCKSGNLAILKNDTDNYSDSRIICTGINVCSCGKILEIDYQTGESNCI